MESSKNKTFIPLGINNIYIGYYDNVIQYETVIINLLADSNCEIIMYQSSDKNHYQSTTYNYTANQVFNQLAVLYQPYVYFTVRNTGNNAQTVLNFNVLYKATQIFTLPNTVNVSQSGYFQTLNNGPMSDGDPTAIFPVAQYGSNVSIYGHSTDNTVLTINYVNDNNSIPYATSHIINVSANRDYSLDFKCASPYIIIYNSAVVSNLAINCSVTR